MNLENPTAEEQQKYYAFFMRKGFSYAAVRKVLQGPQIIRRIFFGNNQRNSRKGRRQYHNRFQRHSRENKKYHLQRSRRSKH